MRLLPLKQSNLLKKEFGEAIIKLFQKNTFFESTNKSTFLSKTTSKIVILMGKKCVFLTKINKDFSFNDFSLLLKHIESSKINSTKKIIYSF